MSVKSAHQKRAQRSIIYLTFFLLLSIPLMLFGIAQDDFDIRREAFEDLQLSEENPCLISLPNVNPYSLEIDKTVTVQVDAMMKDHGILRLKILDQEEIVHEESFEGSPLEIGVNFPFTPKEEGKVSLTGKIETIQGSIVECQITSEYGIRGLRAVQNNSAPEFTSNPSESIPSQNIQTGDTYEYTLKATDIDGDRINYAYSFTPRADWLTLNVIDDGSDGRLTLKFSGSTQKAASYLANVFIHDGYSKHLRSQSWVINVSPSENDIPVVTILEPEQSLRIDRGTTFKTSWKATDLNHIVGYELFIANNLANQETWIEIDRQIPYETTQYNVNTDRLNPGTYKIIAKATDNQQPPATGKGVSPEIVISSVGEEIEEPEDTDDGVIIAQPQVTNMSPLSTEEITNRRVTLRATIAASTNAQIDEDSIVFKLDDRDVSEEIKINRISQEEFTLIYQPDRDLAEGLHKAEVEFSDTNGLQTSKSWNFTIQPDEIITDDIYIIFGYEIAKNIVHIIGVGILTVALALITPFVIFSIWKDDKTEEVNQKNSKIPNSIPSDEAEYIQESTWDDSSTIKAQVEDSPREKNLEEDVWDKYSVAKPVLTEEQKQKDLREIKERDFEDKSTEQRNEQAAPEPKAPESKKPVIKQDNEVPSSIGKEEPIQKQEEPQTKVNEEKTPEAQPPQPETPNPEPKQNQAETPGPDIPEPEIPQADELEAISKQLQQIKEQEKQQPSSQENVQTTN